MSPFGISSCLTVIGLLIATDLAIFVEYSAAGGVKQFPKKSATACRGSVAKLPYFVIASVNIELFFVGSGSGVASECLGSGVPLLLTNALKSHFIK